MTVTSKNYLGETESQLDGIRYEIGVREEGNGRFRGLLRCMACATMQPTAKLKQTAGEAVDLAKKELAEHHEHHHDACHEISPL